MPSEPRILDNETATVADRLRRHLRDADGFDFVSAYFTIHGYALLADELDRLGAARFLFGDPASVAQMAPGDKEPRPFDFTEAGLAPHHTLRQRHLARRCAAWMSQDRVAVRSIRQPNFLHGKMYLSRGPGDGAAAIVGSSNFTRRGLGGGGPANLEINLSVTDPDTLAELRAWFDRLWQNEPRTTDVKAQALESLSRIGRDYAPEAVYFKALYELFRREIEARLAGDAQLEAAGFTASQIWNALYEFQKDGAKSVIARLQEHHGCILADSVGLGKTYTALAAIKYFELQNERVLVLCPRKLRENWSLYQAGNGHRQNPFPDDRFAYTLLSHTDLSRDSGSVGGVDLANFHWGNYGLVVIDESHNFRNEDGRRYRRLLEEVMGGGIRTKALLLSATPVNTSLDDLRSQIYLITGQRETAFRDTLGIGSIRATMTAAQRQFRDWETGQSRQPRRDKSALLANLGADFLRLLAALTISRSRRQVERFYAAEMERIGPFPRHAAPVNVHPPTDTDNILSYQELAGQIDHFQLAVYQPTSYVVDPARLAELTAARQRQNFNQQDSERYLVGMMRTNLLKRLESSPHSLALTLERTIAKIEAALKQINRHQQPARPPETLAAPDALPDDDEEDEEFYVNRGRRPYRLSELDLPRWQADLQQDQAILEAALKQVKAVGPERDGKLAALRQAVRRKAEHPAADRDGNPNRKLLVFTTFKDTAKYLYHQLSGLAAELGLNLAMVSGDETMTTAGANNFNAILSNFAPAARQRRPDANGAAADIDLLIATDCISEGQNLQDCDTVINYDIHWNPVRIIQRFGRIDRIGSRNPAVQLVCYWPTADMDAYLNLQSRVQARMALADITATGDEDPFDESQRQESARQQLSFRDAQLLKLREEALSLEDLDDVVTAGDFTLDHFLAQLLRYLERNREMLEAMPPGAYAVAPATAPSPAQAAPPDAAAAASVRPGVIFLLRQRNDAAADGRPPAASPVHPFYLVYILNDGNIRYGCANARQTLTAFESAAAGKTAPIAALCARFDRETQQGQDMSAYDKLIRDAVAHIVQSQTGAQTRQLRPGGARDFLLPETPETPTGAQDFELVAWLVIMGDRPTPSP